MKTIYFILLLVFILYNCDDLDQSQKKSPTLSPLGSLGFGADSLCCVKGCYGVISDRDRIFVINTNKAYNEFKEYVSSLEINNWPSIDFNKTTMLAGVKIEGAICAKLLPQNFSIIRLQSDYIFTVVIRPGGYHAMGAVIYWALTDKIDPGADVEFIIEHQSN